MINKALRLLGLLASGETPTAAESLDSLESLNALIDAFSASPLYYYTNLDEPFPLIVGKAKYTIGVGGDFNVARPIRLLAAFVRSGFSDSPLGVVTEQYWNNIQDKSTTAPIATKVLYRPSFPLGEIILYPVPSAAIDLHLKTERTVQQYPDLTTDYELPPGYRRLLELSLAIDLAAEYGAKVPEQTVMFLKADMDALMKTNAQQLQASKLQIADNQSVAATVK